jgi:hypothetical protein
MYTKKLDLAVVLCTGVLLLGFLLLLAPRKPIHNASNIRLESIQGFTATHRDNLIVSEEDRLRASPHFARSEGFVGGVHQGWNATGDIVLLAVLIWEERLDAVEKVEEMKTIAEKWEEEQLSVRDVSPMGAKLGARTSSFVCFDRDKMVWEGGLFFSQRNVFVEIRVTSRDRDLLASMLQEVGTAQLDKIREAT